MKEFLKKINAGKSLNEEEMRVLMEKIMDGKLSPVLTAGILVGLSMKGEAVEEIVGAVKVMREKAEKIRVNLPVLMDTCGTGGDGKGSFNFSTLSAFILASGGVPVAKHGNRALSSRCGSADLIEGLGVDILSPPEKTREGIEKIKIGFLFAPLYHKAMKNVAEIRKELGTRTIFNLLGPLSNPASPTHQIIGIFSEDFMERYAIAMKMLGIDGMVVHSNGYDELTTTGLNRFIIVKKGKIDEKKLSPEEFGFKKASPEELIGGNVNENIEIFKRILKGEKIGAIYETTILNAGAGFFVCDEVPSIEKGIEKAEELLKSGAAEKKVLDFVEFFRKL
jgi:anthranilate phosphoribosyltransferase